MTKKSGFTLIELMIVIAIIAIIAAIAIPNLLRSRIQANEAGALQNLRACVSAEAAYHAQNNHYTATLSDLTDATPPFLNGDWTVAKNGYTYEFGGVESNYTINANPTTFWTTGTKGFYCDASGIIRYELGAPATVDSTPIPDI